MSRFPAIACSVLLIVSALGCARLGYTDRVLHRVPSPDGKIVAVCQEVPVSDGPEFDVRLEQPDGRLIRKLYHMGDGGGCNELAWSADGRTLAVLTTHVAAIGIIDVDWAMSHLDVRNTHWFVRGFNFSTDSLKRATDLRFVSPLEVEFQLCEYSLAETQRNGGKSECSQPARRQRLRIPSPLTAGRQS